VLNKVAAIVVSNELVRLRDRLHVVLLDLCCCLLSFTLHSAQPSCLSLYDSVSLSSIGGLVKCHMSG
jgi:hypothetical protein